MRRPHATATACAPSRACRSTRRLVSIRYEEEDVIALVQSSVKCCAVVLQFRDYRLVDKEYFMLDEMSEFSEAALAPRKESAGNRRWRYLRELRAQFVLQLL